MKKPIRSILFPLLFMYLILMCFFPCVQAKEASTVTVDGVSTIIGEDRARRGDTTAAQKLAMRMQADVIIAGKVYTEKLPKHEYFEGTNWVSSKAYRTVRAVIAETGEILDVASPEKPAAGLTHR